jgi:hypothetical protein
MDNLYELTNDYLTLMEFADSTDPDDEQVFLDTLEGLMGAVEAKADSYAAVISHMDAHEDLLQKEIDRLTAKKTAISNNKKRMKDSLQSAMIAMDQKTIKTDLHTFRVQKNGGKQPLDIFGDVPDKFQKIVYEPDKDLIRKALENGEELEFAVLKERGEHLVIS